MLCELFMMGAHESHSYSFIGKLTWASTQKMEEVGHKKDSVLKMLPKKILEREREPPHKSKEQKMN